MMKNKIKKIESLKKLVSQLKAKGKKIVFTNGCFDILHFGHIYYLSRAKKKGDILIIAVNSDKSIRKIKGPTRPVQNQKDRTGILSALEFVDFITIFNEANPYSVIKDLKPNVLVKGADWKKKDIIGADIVRKYGGRVCTIKFLPNRSTTRTLSKIKHL